MKSKNYYDILGVASHVGPGQIQAAYRFTRGLYVGESNATYGLLDDAERTQMLEMVEDAYNTLSNPNARKQYDATLGGRESSPPPAPPPNPAPVAPQNRSTERREPLRPAAIPAVVQVPTTPLSVPETVNGSVLRALREKRNLSIDQIAALSKVGSRFLRALEDDKHEALPGRVFARGFLIEYARALHVPEAEIVERYLRHWTSK